MEFRFEDILKKIIPGSVLFLGVTLILLNQLSFEDIKRILKSDLKEYSEVLLLIILIASYLLGYINDSLSSLLENYVIYNCTKKPSYKILKDICRKKHKIYNLDKIILKIKEDSDMTWNNSEITDQESTQIFKFLNQTKKDNESLKEYYFSYIFARNIFFAFTFLSISIIISNHLNLGWISYFIILLVLIVMYNRRLEKSYYYSRKIILTSLQK